MLVYNDTKKNQWNRRRKHEFTKGKVRNSLPNQGRFLGKFWGRIWAAFPLVSGKNLQKPASKKLAGNAAKHTQSQENFLFLDRKFHMKSPSKK